MYMCIRVCMCINNVRFKQVSNDVLKVKDAPSQDDNTLLYTYIYTHIHIYIYI